MKNCRRKGNMVITGEVVIINSDLMSPKKRFGTKNIRNHFDPSQER